LSSADILQTREGVGSSDADVCTLQRKKLRIFRNLWRVRTDKAGGGQFFAILCERLSWTAPSFNFCSIRLVYVHNIFFQEERRVKTNKISAVNQDFYANLYLSFLYFIYFY